MSDACWVVIDEYCLIGDYTNAYKNKTGRTQKINTTIKKKKAKCKRIH